MFMFLFLVVALAVVVAAVTLAVVGGGDSAVLPEAAGERLRDPLPADRPAHWALYAVDAQDRPQAPLAGLHGLVDGR